MSAEAKRTIAYIELWHFLMLLAALALLAPARLVEPGSLMLGGVFMGLNFFLLGYGVAWLLGPLAGRRRVKTGVGFLVAKVVLFVALLALVFFRLELEPISFAVGFSTLLLSILVESVRTAVIVRA